MTLQWPTESLGFVYGILLALFISKVKNWMKKEWIKEALIFFALSVAVGVSYMKFKSVDFFGDYCLKILLGIVLTTFILLLTAQFKIGNAVSKFIGNFV